MGPKMGRVLCYQDTKVNKCFVGPKAQYYVGVNRMFLWLGLVASIRLDSSDEDSNFSVLI